MPSTGATKAKQNRCNYIRKKNKVNEKYYYCSCCNQHIVRRENKELNELIELQNKCDKHGSSYHSSSWMTISVEGKIY